MMCYNVLDKKEKSSNSVIFPESWFKHFTELFRKKTSEHHFIPDDDDDFCYKHVQTPGMSPPRAGAWTYCLFTP